MEFNFHTFLLLFLCEFSFPEFFEGGLLQIDFLPSKELLLLLFCIVLKTMVNCFLTLHVSVPVLHFSSEFLFLSLLLSLSYSVMIVLSGSSSVQGLTWKDAYSGRSFPRVHSLDHAPLDVTSDPLHSEAGKTLPKQHSSRSLSSGSLGVSSVHNPHCFLHPPHIHVHSMQALWMLMACSSSLYLGFVGLPYYSILL